MRACLLFFLIILLRACLLFFLIILCASSQWAALGAQAGEARLREVITAGGFATVRRAAETPFNMILEARL